MVISTFRSVSLAVRNPFIFSVAFALLRLTVKCLDLRQLATPSRLLLAPPPHPASAATISTARTIPGRRAFGVQDVEGMRSIYPTNCMESLEWITDLARFEAIASDWDALAGIQEMPFLMSSW